MGKKKILFVGLILGLIIGGISVFVYFNNFKSTSGNSSDKRKTVQVVVLTKKVNKGDTVNNDSIKMESRVFDELPLDTVTRIDIIQGKKALINITENTVLTTQMFTSSNSTAAANEKEYANDDRLQDYEFVGGLVAGTVIEGDYVDIQYVNPKGLTSVVLSKKKVMRRLENSLILKLNAKEMQLINQSFAEKLTLGGMLKSALYLDESQPASPVTYFPSPNIGNANFPVSSVNATNLTNQQNQQQQDQTQQSKSNQAEQNVAPATAVPTKKGR